MIQGEGLGVLLMCESLVCVDELGWVWVMLVGDLFYYQCFGFVKFEGVVMLSFINFDCVLGFDLDDGVWVGIQGDVECEIWCDVVVGFVEICRDFFRSQVGVDYDLQVWVIIWGK